MTCETIKMHNRRTRSYLMTLLQNLLTNAHNRKLKLTITLTTQQTHNKNNNNKMDIRTLKGTQLIKTCTTN